MSITSTSWMRDQVLPCQTYGEPDLWHSDDPDDRDLAKSICADCPMMDRCDEYGQSLSGKKWGIWGGRESTRRRNGRRACQYGHDWAPENTGSTPAGRRYCLTCAGEPIPRISAAADADTDEVGPIMETEQPELFAAEAS